MILIGCKSTSTIQRVAYLPQGKEQFIFIESVENEERGYTTFCLKTLAMSCSLGFNDYVKHKGMRGYFETTVPEKVLYGSVEFYPVVLENGEKLYYRQNTSIGRYGSSIINYNDYLAINAFQPEPLITGSDIMVTGYKINFDKKFYNLSDGSNITASKLAMIREITSKQKVAELLLSMDIEKDEIEKIYFINASLDDASFKIYVGRKNKEQWLRMKVSYSGAAWVFAKSFKVAADEFRWQSPQYKFSRDSYINVWETLDLPLTSTHLNVAERIAKAEQASIRFYGNDRSVDKTINQKEKQNIVRILELFHLMGNTTSNP